MGLATALLGIDYSKRAGADAAATTLLYPPCAEVLKQGSLAFITPNGLDERNGRASFTAIEDARHPRVVDLTKLA